MWRLVELKRALWQVEDGDERVEPWQKRLDELEALHDPIDRLLAEVEAQINGDERSLIDPSQLELFERGERRGATESHDIRLGNGHLFRGSWDHIVRQMRDQAGFSHETMSQYMRRLAERWHEQLGVEIPFADPESFLEAAICAGAVYLED